MPFVITTSKKGPRGPFDSSASVSRVAVGTLEEALAGLAFPSRAKYEDALVALRLSSGGTVGPLPDGSLIEVEPRSWFLAAADCGLVSSACTESEILAAFNEANR